MTQFLDGPAAGVKLTLHRAPLLLRVVHSARGEWDALDQLDDRPRADEQIIVYYRASVPTQVHVDYRRGRESAWYEFAEYRALPQQPQDVYIRATEAWRPWCNGSGLEGLRRAREGQKGESSCETT